MYEVPINLNEPYQEQVLNFTDMRIRITLIYNSVAKFWAMNLYDQDNKREIAHGLPLVVATPLLNRTTEKFDFLVTDDSGNGLDPILLEDLGFRNVLLIDTREAINEAVRQIMGS